MGKVVALLVTIAAWREKHFVGIWHHCSTACACWKLLRDTFSLNSTEISFRIASFQQTSSRNKLYGFISGMLA